MCECDEKEVEIEKVFELLIEHQRKKAHDGVFLIPNFIWSKISISGLSCEEEEEG